MSFRRLAYLSAFMVFLSLLSSGVMSEEPAPEPDQPGFWNGTRLPLGMAHNLYDYNETSHVMTDSGGLTFQKHDDGYIIVGDGRFLAFALTGTAGGTDYKYTSMDFDWTWSVQETADGHHISATNNNPLFLWEQHYHFYEDPWKPMKIEHYRRGLGSIVGGGRVDQVMSFNATDFYSTLVIAWSKGIGRFSNGTPTAK